MRPNRTWWVYAGLAGVLCLWLSTGPAAQATSSTSKTTVLVQAPVAPLQIVSHGRTTDGAPWLALLHTVAPSDGFVVDNKFDPGQTSGWHSHPGPSVIFVVTGTVTNHESTSGGCEVASYSAGSSFVDEGGDHVHMISNDGTQPAETIAVQFIPKGQPRRIDEPAPSC